MEQAAAGALVRWVLSPQNKAFQACREVPAQWEAIQISTIVFLDTGVEAVEADTGRSTILLGVSPDRREYSEARVGAIRTHQAPVLQEERVGPAVGVTAVRAVPAEKP